MPTNNKFHARGYLTKDAVVKTYGQGENAGQYAMFTLGISRRGRDAGSDFVTFKVFGKRAETMQQYGKKGTHIELDAHIQTGSFEKDGQTVYTEDKIVDDFSFVPGSGSKKSEAQAPAKEKTPEPQASVSDNPEGFMDIPEGAGDEGIPFSF